MRCTPTRLLPVRARATSRLIAVVLAVGLTLGACGAPGDRASARTADDATTALAANDVEVHPNAPVHAAELGACDPDILARTRAAQLAGGSGSWGGPSAIPPFEPGWWMFEADVLRRVLAEATPVERDGDEDYRQMPLNEATHLAGHRQHAQVVVDPLVIDRLTQAVEHDYQIAIAVPLVDDATSTAAAIIDADGRVGYLGHCAYDRYTTYLADFTTKAVPDLRPFDVFLTLAEGDEELHRRFNDWLYPPPPAWEDLDPDQRHLSAGTPPEVLDTLEQVTLGVHVPPSWRHAPYVIIPRVPGLGWNEGASLAIAPPITMYVYTEPGTDLELWLLDDVADTTAPIARLARIPAETMATYLATDDRSLRVLRLVTTTDPPDLAQIVADPTVAEHLFTVETITLDEHEAEYGGATS